MQRSFKIVISNKCEIREVKHLLFILCLLLYIPHFAVYHAQKCGCALYTGLLCPWYIIIMPCIMCILIFPSKIGVKSTHYTWQNIVLSEYIFFLVLFKNKNRFLDNFDAPRWLESSVVPGKWERVAVAEEERAVSHSLSLYCGLVSKPGSVCYLVAWN